MALEAVATRVAMRIGDGAPQPVDLVHLAHQTFGDAELEREVLAMFERNARLYFLRLRGALKPRERREAAHLINGSARGIGAWRVAELAAALEDVSAQTSGALEALEAAIDEAVSFIRSITP